jgi:hypothetical protein
LPVPEREKWTGEERIRDEQATSRKSHATAQAMIAFHEARSKIGELRAQAGHLIDRLHSVAMQRPAFVIAVCLLSPVGSFAQLSEAAVLPDAPSACGQSQQSQRSANPLSGGVEFVQLLERKSLVFPDLATGKQPFTSRDKFMLAVNNSVSLSTIGAALLGAGYGQAIDSPEGYGQGGEGYAKRFGSEMARAASGNLFGTFLIASVLHEDPRFYVKKDLSFSATVKYSAVRIAMTQSDSGKRTVNFAGLLGPLAGEALANTYFPEGSRGFDSTAIRYASDLGWRFGGNLLRQYWPKINRKLRLVPVAPESTPTSKETQDEPCSHPDVSPGLIHVCRKSGASESQRPMESATDHPSDSLQSSSFRAVDPR